MLVKNQFLRTLNRFFLHKVIGGGGQFSASSGGGLTILTPTYDPVPVCFPGMFEILQPSYER